MHPTGKWPILLSLAYLVFVIYGSLVPLDFRPRPLDEALERFVDIRWLELGIGSRADWVANVLLFIPLAFLFEGWRHRWGGRRKVRVPGLPVLIGCMLFSTGIEFLQVFFPPRTVSLNDIAAETLGAMIGIVLWHVRGPFWMAWMEGWRREHTLSGTLQRLLVVYLLILFGYNLLPLDLTISPVELYHKWKEGKLHLVPFTYGFEDPATALYTLTTDAVIWIPVGFLLARAFAFPRRKAALAGLGMAAMLEFLQIFVYSRVTDVTDILLGGTGALVGAFAAGHRTVSGAASGPRRSALRPWLAAWLGWTLLLLAIFWYPYDFTDDPATIRERLDRFWRMPFIAYYYGTEFRAVTEVLHKTAFFLPLGVLLYLPVPRMRVGRHYESYLALVILALIGTPLLVEFGQVLLPGKTAGSTDLALEILGGLLGFLLARMVISRRTTVT